MKIMLNRLPFWICTLVAAMLTVDAKAADFATTGTLRATFIGRNPVHAKGDARSGSINVWPRSSHAPPLPSSTCRSHSLACPARRP
jgi:hypothetical protein